MIYQMSLTSLNQYYLLAILPSSIQTPMHHTISNIVNNKLKQTGCGWMSTNKLNIEKTYYIVFGSKLSNEIHLQIDNVNITIKKTKKFLGLYINKRLNLNTHIQYTGKVSNCWYILKNHILYSPLFYPFTILFPKLSPV